MQLPWCTATHHHGLWSGTKNAIEVLCFKNCNKNKINKPPSRKLGWCMIDDAPLSLQGMVLIIIFQYDLPRSLTTLMCVSLLLTTRSKLWMFNSASLIDCSLVGSHQPHLMDIFNLYNNSKGFLMLCPLFTCLYQFVHTIVVWCIITFSSLIVKLINMGRHDTLFKNTIISLTFAIII